MSKPKKKKAPAKKVGGVPAKRAIGKELAAEELGKVSGGRGPWGEPPVTTSPVKPKP